MFNTSFSIDSIELDSCFNLLHRHDVNLRCTLLLLTRGRGRIFNAKKKDARNQGLGKITFCTAFHQSIIMLSKF